MLPTCGVCCCEVNDHCTLAISAHRFCVRIGNFVQPLTLVFDRECIVFAFYIAVNRCGPCALQGLDHTDGLHGFPT